MVNTRQVENRIRVQDVVSLWCYKCTITIFNCIISVRVLSPKNLHRTNRSIGYFLHGFQKPGVFLRSSSICGCKGANGIFTPSMICPDWQYLHWGYVDFRRCLLKWSTYWISESFDRSPISRNVNTLCVDFHGPAIYAPSLLFGISDKGVVSHQICQQ